MSPLPNKCWDAQKRLSLQMITQHSGEAVPSLRGGALSPRSWGCSASLVQHQSKHLHEKVTERKLKGWLLGKHHRALSVWQINEQDKDYSFLLVFHICCELFRHKWIFPAILLTVKFLFTANLEILHEEKRHGVCYALKMQNKPELNFRSSSHFIFVIKFFLLWVLNTSSSPSHVFICLLTHYAYTSLFLKEIKSENNKEF